MTCVIIAEKVFILLFFFRVFDRFAVTVGVIHISQ